MNQMSTEIATCYSALQHRRRTTVADSNVVSKYRLHTAKCATTLPGSTKTQEVFRITNFASCGMPEQRPVGTAPPLNANWEFNVLDKTVHDNNHEWHEFYE